ncbi:ACT domain-containing protein [Tunicatimonas pelagia]|uniref:ACT domain-containing protein n=1 Tax=Tunicatimonas pelagia TaxID=931531 RepID=UPI002665973A|nr:ACT domain-containing protein [Tunicatimonas pelagia]WKN45730.1 ACT domain-containing protein [Tunicatimonas pelagia]
MNVREFLKNCPVEIWSQHFAVVKAKYVPKDFVAVFSDREEITVVVDAQHLNDDWIIESEQGWRMLSFRVTLQFELVGFLAAVAQALADAQISIFALSAYSTDHLLVKDADLPEAIRCLESLGCAVAESD